LSSNFNTKRATSAVLVYVELKKRAKEVGLIINIEKTRAMVQSRRPGKGGMWTAGDHKIEMVRRFKYLGAVINDTIDETEEIRARILAANKAYMPIQTYSSKQQDKTIQNAN